MTSKEALELAILDSEQDLRDDIYDNNWVKSVLQGLKDCQRALEVLDIIKKWSFIQENYKDGYGKFTQFLCNIHTIGMEEDFLKVEEWFKNDK